MPAALLSSAQAFVIVAVVVVGVCVLVTVKPSSWLPVTTAAP